jgi:DNA (cytosine-5)-methyltransferase 1
MLRVGGVFSGIGGLELGFERAGMKISFHCEKDFFCQCVLHRHWPDVPIFDDVSTLLQNEIPEVDVLCGGFPCQPISIAGSRGGCYDERWLWPAFLNVINEIKPLWVVIENVQGLRTKGLRTILAGLAYGGYDAEWDCLPAAAFGAPHIRYRFFIIAYPRSAEQRKEGPRVFKQAWRTQFAVQDFMASNTAYTRLQRRITPKGEEGQRKMVVTRMGITHGRSWPFEPNVDRVGYGIPLRVDRIRSLGNAVVPKVAEWVGRRIVDYEIENQ